MLLDGDAFTPQATPSSGRTITVEQRLQIEVDHPMIRMVRPETDAGSPVNDQPVGVSRGFISDVRCQPVLGDGAAPVAPVDAFTHTLNVLRAHYMYLIAVHDKHPPPTGRGG